MDKNEEPTRAIAVAPGLEPTLATTFGRGPSRVVDRRVAFVSALAIGVGLLAGFVARGLDLLIRLITNLAYFGRVSVAPAAPYQHHLGAMAVLVPVVGGVIVGLMARYGSRAIRGHGIPEAMEQVLVNESRIPLKMTFLKPLSAAIAIGSGGPFGAEGPIIATGGALGSFVGQVIRVSAVERKTLLAAGAAAGMTGIFGSPVSAVLLAVELLLFEYRVRSVVPVSFAAFAACAVRLSLVGDVVPFAMPAIAAPSGPALAIYAALGVGMGVLAVGITRAVYAVEDAFEKLPIPETWWPALGGLAVGLVGLVAPHTLGVGYDNITGALSSSLPARAVLLLAVAKFVSWVLALGSGTSGGTLAPLLTMGSAVGSALGLVVAATWPALGVDARIAALVGMAALFAGASRAFLASCLFAFETTRSPEVLLPLLGGCAAAHFVASWWMPTSIMTEKLARRGLHVGSEYASDPLGAAQVLDYASRAVVTLPADLPAAEAQLFVTSEMAGGHQGFAVVDEDGAPIGVLTRRDLMLATDVEATAGSLASRPPIAISTGSTLRHALDAMVANEVGRVLVVDDAGRLAGIVTRGDILRAHAHAARAEKPVAGVLPSLRRARAS